jgi:heat shock protein HslJ
MIYDNAQRYPFESVGDPGLSIFGNGAGCNTVTGSYQVEELTLTAGGGTSFTATFEQHCEGAAPALRGCVHVRP